MISKRVVALREYNHRGLAIARNVGKRKRRAEADPVRLVPSQALIGPPIKTVDEKTRALIDAAVKRRTR